MAQQPPAAPGSSVDPFIGTEAEGDVTPGPSLPFGMVKPGPDVGKNTDNSGWNPKDDINGFSQVHVSGTGGGASYGNILLQPTTGNPQARGYGSPREQERASLGFYGVRLQRYAIDVEVTAADRASLYRFKYPQSDHANLLFDAGHCLSSGAEYGEDQQITASAVKVESSRAVSGWSSVRGGWNKQPVPYTVYFYAVTDTPALTWGTWRNGELRPGSKVEEKADKVKTGAWLSFRTGAGQIVRVKIGISFVSVEQAKTNALRQISGFDFDRTLSAAVSAWNQALSAIEVEGATPSQRQTFYTALYHTMLMPVDRTGENPLWKSSEPYYDDFYAIWDTFRTSTPLLTLIAQARQSEILRSLVDMYRHEGWIPDARQGNYNGRTQGGSNGDIMFADGFVKGLKGIDWETAYKGLVTDAEVSPKDQLKEGRGGLQDWHKLGYLSIEGVDRPASKQMEYAADDFAVATVARGLGKTADAKKYFQRANNWANLWDSTFEDAGFRGFIRPRHRDGRWKVPFSATEGCTFGGDSFYEGNTWTYSLFVPQDVAGLMNKAGGRQHFVERLDAFFDGRRFDVTNEPGFLTPYLYIWAGRADKTAERVREIVNKKFHTGRNGLPGNDDSGAMSSLYAFDMIGVFPVAGQDIYLIGSPSFSSTFHLANGKTFTVQAESVSAENKYVVEAALNGKPLRQGWFRHADLAGGGRLVLRMSSRPGAWPDGNPPPSLSDSVQE